METTIIKQYGEIRHGVIDDMSITVLHIGGQQTTLVTGIRAEPSAVFNLPIGSQKTAAEHFHHDPPTPGEFENAIVAVEDAVANARTMIPDGSMLYSVDEDIRKIALISGVTERSELILTREAMERTFERLALVSLGRNANQEGIPADHTFSMTLLILRELMHHLQFTSISVKV